jgi:GTPase
MVGANMGLTRMTKEHIGLSLALKLPLIIIITKIDLCPENKLKETVDSIHKILKLNGVKKIPYHVRNEDDVINCAKNIIHDRISPIFMLSCVTGYQFLT